MTYTPSFIVLREPPHPLHVEPMLELRLPPPRRQVALSYTR
jgi:hypothetical protein